MPEPKPLPAEFIQQALDKANHYRLLNEPRLAESICLDVLAVDPGQQEALVVLVLAISDLLERRQNVGVRDARQYIERIEDKYKRAYYHGVVCERRGLTILRAARPLYRHYAYDWLMEALEHYADAEKLAPEGSGEVILRWNTICRIFDAYPKLGPMPDDGPHSQGMLE